MNGNTLTPQLVHAGIELVVGSGITFWLNRKITRVSEKMDELDKKIQFHDSILSQHQELIKKLCHVAAPPASATPPNLPSAPPRDALRRRSAVSLDAPTPSAGGGLPALVGAPSSPLPSEAADPIVVTLGRTSDVAEMDAILSEEINDLKDHQQPNSS